MPTPGERRALLFFSCLTLSGMAVNARAAARQAPPPPDALDRAELHRQILAVDSARANPRARRRGRPTPPPPPPPPTIPLGSGISIAPDSHPRRRLAIATVLPSSIDLDVASATDIERLPRIGPALAARIVANRDSLGPFGSLEEFQRVRGVGPALARAIAPYVTFSLQPRPLHQDGGASGAPTGGRRRRLPKALSP